MDAETWEQWEEEFYEEMEDRGVPGDWELHEDDGLHTQEKGAQYTQRTYGRFLCSVCRRKWNSAEVHVLFFMNLHKALQQGTVKMRIFRQECKKCSFPKLEKPEISHENIMRIIKNLVSRILQVFYGEKKAKQDWKPEVYSKDMEGPHDKEHCEACKLMICKWQRLETKQSTLRASVQKKAEHTSITHARREESWSDGITPSYVYQSTVTYPGTVTNVRSTTTYPGTVSNVRSTATNLGTVSNVRSTSGYPKYKTADSSPCETEASASPIVYSLIAGIGALALWYLKR